MDEEILADEKRMKLRYPGTCRVCSAELPAKTEALYERSTKTIRCIEHGLSSAFPTGPNEAIDPGIPGASARREFERRHARREQRIRAAHPKLGGLIHALTDDPRPPKRGTPALSGKNSSATGSTSFRPSGSAFCTTAACPAPAPPSTTWP